MSGQVQRRNAQMIELLKSEFAENAGGGGVDPGDHTHSKLVASDGIPDPALSEDAVGYLTQHGDGAKAYYILDQGTMWDWYLHPSTDATIYLNIYDVGAGDFDFDIQNFRNMDIFATGQIDLIATQLDIGTDVEVQNDLVVLADLTAAGNVQLCAGAGHLTLDVGTGVNEFSIDGTLAGNSDDAVPTEKAVKTYVDNVVVAPFGSAFLAHNSVDDPNQTGNGAVPTIDFDTEVYDVGGDFAADTFTAPATGTYLLATNVLIYNVTAAMTFGVVRIVTSNRNYVGTQGDFGAMRTAGNVISGSVVAAVDMDAADTATVEINLSNGVGNTAGVKGHAATMVTFFCGHRIT